MKGFIVTVMTLLVLTQEIALPQQMTISEIAQATGVSTKEIEKLNPKISKEKIHFDTIRFPNKHVHRVQPDEQLSHILKRYHLTEKEFQNYNPHFHSLQTNQWLALSPKGLAILFEPQLTKNPQIEQRPLHTLQQSQKYDRKQRARRVVQKKITHKHAKKDKLIQPVLPFVPNKVISLPKHNVPINLYTQGQCTFYAFQRRLELNSPISNLWGDAKYWGDQARYQGFVVNNTPQLGAILVTKEGVYGHVAIVEKILPTHIIVSEMNWIAPYVVNQRIIYDFNQYDYIH